ncbi:radical SAM protein [Exilibacterium tricleocarpae]|uniref:radical SAM protein n=1 Tax=Exilibacterium tricleocarpae TaxID=2591008 RepID=UPI0015D426FA|nr:radical SAM protein [Exilibacterium tricleocarpae]
MKFGERFKKKFFVASSENYLNLTILPTEKCNFRCTYCYEDFALGKMSTDTIKGIKSLLSKAAPTLKGLSVNWFGGEPTLHIAAVKDISRHIMALRRKREFGYAASMTTNGYLLDRELLAELCALGIRKYQISLDGDKIDHDTTRKLTNGTGSFAKIWGNLLSFRGLEDQFKIILRLNISSCNSVSMLKLCERIKSRLLVDKRYVVNIEKINNLGEGISSDVEQYVAKDVDDTIARIRDSVGLSLRDQDETDKQSDPYICYAAMPNHLMIRADGSLGKCTVMLKDDRNIIGHLNTDGTYTLDNRKMELWTRGFVDMDAASLGCPAYRLPSIHTRKGVINSVTI